MKILVTGGSGFFGANIIPKLTQNGCEALILTRSSQNLNQKLKGKPQLQVIEGSLSQLSEVSKQIQNFSPQVCLHLAWEGIPDYSLEVSKKNLDQSIQLIDFLCGETNCKKIVVSGSCFEYGSAKGQLSESHPESNESGIAWAKNSLKNYLQIKAREKKLDWIWMRVFYAFGPGQRRQSLIPSLVEAAQKGLPSPIRNPNHANDFIHIEEVAAAFVKASLSPVESGIYNLGSGKLVKVSDVWDLVRQSFSDKNSIKSFETAESEGARANISKSVEKLGLNSNQDIYSAMKSFIAYLNSQEGL